MARTITDKDIDILIERFREIFYDKQESEEKMRQIVREETQHLPTRDEFYEQTEKLYKRQNDLEEEKDMLSHRVSIHTDQITKIAKHINLTIED